MMTNHMGNTGQMTAAGLSAQAATDQMISSANLSLAQVPLLEGESAGDLHHFRMAAMDAIQPRDAIEAVWLQDFISYTWESMRLRRLKIEIVTGAQKTALHYMLNGLPTGELPYADQKELIRNWARQEPAAIDEVNRLLTSLGQSMDNVVTAAFRNQLDDVDQIDKLIGHYDQRRDNAIKELEKRRDTLARRAYIFSQTFSDADFDEDNDEIEAPGNAAQTT